jgi:RHS repeat-associated protein
MPLGCSTSAIDATLVEGTFQYYGADGKLRLVDRRTCLVFGDVSPPTCDTGRLPLGNQRSAFEEYRYDALGRRVLVRSRQAYLCAQNCQNVVRRTIWDGDQVLAEIQAPGATGTSAAWMEADAGLEQNVDTTSLVVPRSLLDSAQVAPSDTVPQGIGGTGFQTGSVLYTHGPGIDAPLSLIRSQYSDLLPGSYLVVLHHDWRGEYDLGSYASGSLSSPCVRVERSSNFQTIVPDGTISDWTKAPSPLNTSWMHCVEVEWPAPHVWITRATRNRSLIGPPAWMGTLIDGMRDNSGQMYMRNRYYDPASGRFTQEDPIGLAGGLNAYGFAAGDPVSYQDPYGLKACDGTRSGVLENVACWWRMQGVSAKVEQIIDHTRDGFRFLSGYGQVVRRKLAAGHHSRVAIGMVPIVPGAVAFGAAGEAAEIPEVIYREGKPSPSNLRPRPGEDAVSFRTSLSNPLPGGSRPVFRPGEPYFGVETASLPPEAVTVDNNPAGHVGVSGVPPEVLQDAVTVRGKFPE